MMKLETRTDPDAETILNFANVQYVIKEVSIEDIDWIESANNCARMENPLNSEKIEDYRASMVAGDVFPMPVLELGKSGLVVIGGNQRLNAAKRIDSEMILMAYVARPLLSTQREVLIRSLNARHGWGSDKEERILHAVYLVQKHGMSTVDASRIFIVSGSSILLRIRADEMRLSLVKKNIDAGRLSLGALASIGLVQDEQQAATIARAAVENSATGDQVADVVKKVAAAKSTAGKIKAINEVKKGWSESIRQELKSNGMKRPRRVKFFRLAEVFAEFLERGNDGEGFHTMDDLQCDNTDTEKMLLISNKILVRLNMIRGAL
jgi:hypothetical protein